MEKIYDVIIVGAGPAGLTAGIYAGRGNLSTLILEKEGIGSMIMTHQIDNYPGSLRLVGHPGVGPARPAGLSPGSRYRRPQSGAIAAAGPDGVLA